MASHDSPGEENRRLAARLLGDDESVLAEILRLYGPFLFKALGIRFVHTLGVLRREDIEDVLSIALRRVWDARKSYDIKRMPLRGWFYIIAERAARDILKTRWHKAWRQERNVGQDWLEVTIAAGQPDPPAPGASRRKATGAEIDLRAIVNELPDMQRRIVMTDVATGEGVASGNLLADELSIPAATVRVYRKRAMDKIRFEMTKRGYDVRRRRENQS